MSREKELTGYPSIDKPWLKYYSEDKQGNPMPQGTLYQYLYECNKDNLNDIALNYFGTRISYKNLFENIDTVAKSFVALGVKKGDIVTLLLLNQPETVYCAYALNKIGAVINMVSVLASENELVNYIQEANSNVVVALNLFNEKLIAALPKTSCRKVINVSLSTSMPFVVKTVFNLKTNIVTKEGFISWKDFFALSKNCADVLPNEYIPNSFSFLAHTGGTTGMPKGVKLSDDAINGVVDEYKINLSYKRGEKYLDTIVPFVIYGFAVNMHMPLCLGLENILLPKVDVDKLPKIYIKQKPNHFISVPSYLEALTKVTETTDLSFIKTVGAGGDGMTNELEAALNDCLNKGGSKAKVLNGYGLSEICSTACTCQPSITKNGSVGIPLSRNIISAFDIDTDRETKYGEVGEICIHTPYIMLEYLNNPVATQELIHIHEDGMKWLHTGDLGYVDEDGVVYIVGRIKRIILTEYKGFPSKIFPNNVEKEINKHEAVDNSCVVSMNKSESCIKLKAYVLLKNDCETDRRQIEEELKQLCKETLPEYSLPFRYEFVDSFPLTPVGKVDYKALERMAEEAKKY